ncbi:E3 ubiquitin-protein ligase EL5-like [Panicum miliaceum]|uniref:RING-type E3 ubiquitin transferase n=1 Tax=Panicum miliaceum TaxID=4540 RepID=A0A3L6SSJ3_PANMI|nr:E3 ubiquitin-protein ligase EL5-like [Panicum miliaceum]
MSDAVLSIAGPFIPLGVFAGIGAIAAVIWAVSCCCAAAKEGGGGVGVASPTGKHEGLLNKSKGDVAAGLGPQPGRGGGGQQQRGPGPDTGGDGDVEVCAICKAQLADAGWGGGRRLRPCGHVYHADCIGLWLQRKWTCPVCRDDVLVSPAEIMDAMV